MPMVKKVDAAPLIPKTAVEDAPVAQVEAIVTPKPVVKMPLNATEKDARILVQGITQAILQSPLYDRDHALLTDAVSVEQYLEEKVNYWVKKVKEISEAK